MLFPNRSLFLYISIYICICLPVSPSARLTCNTWISPFSKPFSVPVEFFFFCFFFCFFWEVSLPCCLVLHGITIIDLPSPPPSPAPQPLLGIPIYIFVDIRITTTHEHTKEREREREIDTRTHARTHISVCPKADGKIYRYADRCVGGNSRLADRGKEREEKKTPPFFFPSPTVNCAVYRVALINAVITPLFHL